MRLIVGSGKSRENRPVLTAEPLRQASVVVDVEEPDHGPSI
jgi:hypothetical protein